MRISGQTEQTDMSGLASTSSAAQEGPTTSINMLSAAALSMQACTRENTERPHAFADDCDSGYGALLKIAEEQADSVWENLRQIALILSHRQTTGLADLCAKIKAWRVLAPETLFDEDEQTADEALLCSIIADIERMAA